MSVVDITDLEPATISEGMSAIGCSLLALFLVLGLSALVDVQSRVIKISGATFSLAVGVSIIAIVYMLADGDPNKVDTGRGIKVRDKSVGDYMFWVAWGAALFALALSCVHMWAVVTGKTLEDLGKTEK